MWYDSAGKKKHTRNQMHKQQVAHENTKTINQAAAEKNRRNKHRRPNEMLIKWNVFADFDRSFASPTQKNIISGIGIQAK